MRAEREENEQRSGQRSIIAKVKRANRPARYLTRESWGVVGGFWGS